MTSIDLTRRLGALGLAEKTRLLTGATAWRLASVPAIGLRAVVTSDGPAGVRGTGETPGATSLSFACPSALAATWDTGLARTVGRLFAREARRHGVDVVLAPVVNLQRTPVGGRHFEAASEDPLLSGDIACAFIEGCQAEGVGVCVKHFVANESETMRTSYIATLDERTLREVYLAPFERACRDAHAWSVMASYNGLDDGVEVAPTIAHHRLMLGILKGEWGYDGAVISDWTAAKTAREPALGGLDLVMPGPGGPWADGALQRLVEDGHVPEECVDDKAIRLLRLAERVGALGADDTSVPATPPAPPLAAEDTDGLRRLAGASIVVLKDDDHALPWASAPGSVSLIGPNAVRTYVQGGGSAHVDPPGVITPAGALTGVFPGVAVTVAEGATARVTPPSLDVVRMIDPRTGAAGTARLAVLDAAGRLLGEHDLAEAGGHLEDLPEAADWLRVGVDVRLDEPGEHWLGLGTVGAFELRLDGQVVAADAARCRRDVFIDSSINCPPSHGAALVVTHPVTVRLEAGVEVMRSPEWADRRGFASLRLLHTPPEPSPEAKRAAALDVARAADRVVVIVGTNEQVESEGWDRTDLDLPGDQNALVEAVLAVRPDAVVAVNAGAPVVLPWLGTARTVVWMWFPGQMGGQGLADVLAGRTEPAGRLPWTLPARYEDVPVPNAIPGPDKRIHYTEGRDVGYRGWLRADRSPARPFGYGLGWTTWAYTDGSVSPASDGGLDVRVAVTNTGPRAGRETVQVYLADDQDATRPVRWLAGSAGVEASPGVTVPVVVHVAPRQLEIWDAAAHAWTRPATTYRVLVAHDVADVRIDLTTSTHGPRPHDAAHREDDGVPPSQEGGNR